MQFNLVKNMKIKYFLLSAVLAIAILCSAGFVKAQTADNSALIAQLQAQIQLLMQQIAQIQAQQGNTTARPTSSWCYTFNTSLGFTNSGVTDVTNLHTALQKQGISFGSDNGNTYSTGTSKAVIQFQKKYGIAPLSGYVGLKTRAKLNSLYGCTTTPITQTTCTPNWSCTGFTNSACTNNQQTQTCTDINNCGTTTGEPALTHNGCSVTAITCTPNWQTTGWGACINGQQTRTAADYNGCGTTVGEPAITQSCSACVPNWQTSSWEACVNGQQTRIVSDSNGCGITSGKPATTQSCPICNVNWSCSGFTNSPCINGVKSQTCWDSNNCWPPPANAPAEPALTQSCVGPLVKITSPSVGATLARGQTYNINWNTTNLSSTETISIGLFSPTNPFQDIAYNLPSTTTSYTWTVPTDSATGSNFKLFVEAHQPTQNGYQITAQDSVSNISVVVAQ